MGRRTHFLRRVAAGMVVSALLPLTAFSVATASGPKTGATYVALGDSYSAGEGLDPYQAGTATKDDTCHRSISGAYPDLHPAIVLPNVIDRAFWACSGATIQDMDPPATGGPKPQQGEPVQVQTVGVSTKYITLSVGGNDTYFGDIVKACVEGVAYTTEDGVTYGSYYHLTKTTCQAQLVTSTSLLTSSKQLPVPPLQSGLVSLYTTLLARAPTADIVVVGYPRVLPPSYTKAPKINGNTTCVFNDYYLPGGSTFLTAMTESNAIAVNKFMVRLNAVIQAAVAQVAVNYPDQIKYADTYSVSVPRNCTGTTPGATVNGLMLQSTHHGVDGFLGGFDDSGSFHPTAAGQRLMARVVQNTFERFASPKPATTTTTTTTTVPADSQWQNAQLASFQLDAITCDPDGDLCISDDSNGDVLTSTDPTGGASAWALVNVDDNQINAAMACPSAQLCMVGDSEGNILVSTNPTGGASTWNSSEVSTTGITGISCPSTTMCFASDFDGNVYWTADPVSGSWESETVDSGNWIHGIDCPTTSLCVAADVDGNIAVSPDPAGGNWTVSDVDANNDIFSVSCPTSSLCEAVDGAGNVLTSTDILDNVWTSVLVDSAAYSGGGAAISCPSQSFCAAGDDSGNVLTSTTPSDAATDWTSSHLTSNEMFATYCISSAICLAGDNSGFLYWTDDASG